MAIVAKADEAGTCPAATT